MPPVLRTRQIGNAASRWSGACARRVQLGPRLFVHLVSVLPDPAVGAFPSNHLLGYDLVLGGDAAGRRPRRLGDLGLLAGPRAITLGDLPLPSFFLPARLPALNLLHGSCRLLHGHGEDALLAADEQLAESARDLERRASAMVLTGDQIYGDEVAGPIIGHLTRLGAELLGAGDTTSVPGAPTLDRLPLYGRQELSRTLGFTSGKAANHLFSLGEFAAMYLLAPTDPPMLVLDTRTQRTFDSERGAARLLGDGELDRVRELARRAGVRAPGPAILVSATPIYGLELQERRQKFLAGKVGPYEIDFESWHSNLRGLCDFMRLLVDELGLRSCVVLSGDVHYGLNVQATFAHDGHVLSIGQLVSSGLKHSGMLARTALHLLGAGVRPDHARVGWETPPVVPEAGRASRLLDRLRRRAVNTDAWAEDAPVFLTPTLAERIAAGQPPRFEEARSYVRPDAHRTRVVLGDNNVGLVSVRLPDGVVVHRLLARRSGRTTPHTAALPPRSDAGSPTAQ